MRRFLHDTRLWGWAAPSAVAILALLVRLQGLGSPHAIMFDETYYAKDAYSLLNHGYVLQYTDSANDKILHSDFSSLTDGTPAWIVHPDGGKWLIAIGEQVFGMTPFGWRVSAAVIGSLTVFVLARLALRLTRSVWLAALAGMLMAFDGMAFVMSRMALLDIFVTFWIVCGVAALVVDRDALAVKLDRDARRWYVWRPWQLVAGVCFGLAASTKWSGFVVLAAFAVCAVLWELFARFTAWAKDDVPLRTKLLAPIAVGAPAFAWLVVVALAVYLASWTGWLIHHSAYEAKFGHGYGEVQEWASVAHPWHGPFANIINPLRSLWAYHVMTWDFHTGSYLAHQTHPYASKPLGWLVQYRPVNVYYVGSLPPAGCGADPSSSCLRQVVILGNPAVWWTGVVAYVAVLAAWLVAVIKRHVSWRLSIPLVGLAATWLPWFTSGTRPIFSFYAVATLPFTILAIVLAFNGLSRRATTMSRQTALWLVSGIYVAAAVGLFCFFYPVWTGQLISYEQWRARMWFPSWI